MKSKSAPIFKDMKELVEFVKNNVSGAVVLANGCFDPLHVGHVRYLEGAKEHGGFLVVALNNDRSTRELKGAGRPVLGESDRAQLLAGLAAVDAVLLFGEDDVRVILQTLRPAVHAKGTDYTVESVPELDTSRRLGIKTVITGDPKSHASSEILNEIRNGLAGGDET